MLAKIIIIFLNFFFFSLVHLHGLFQFFSYQNNVHNKSTNFIKLYFFFICYKVVLIVRNHFLKHKSIRISWLLSMPVNHQHSLADLQILNESTLQREIWGMKWEENFGVQNIFMAKRICFFEFPILLANHSQ